MSPLPDQRSYRMPTNGVLLDRIATLRAALHRVSATIAVVAAHEDEGGPVASTLQQWFGKAVNERIVILDDLAVRVSVAASSAELLQCWDDLVDQESYLAPLADQALEVLGGAMLRSVGADDGMGRVAEVLLAGLAKRLDLSWDRVVLPASSDRIDTGSWVVALRFPATDVWGLPILVHEIGHLIIENFTDSRGRRPLRGFVDNMGPSERLTAPQRGELAADALATLLLGPAFTASLVWRSSPGANAGSQGAHPSWSRRVATSLHCLGHLVDGGELTEDLRALVGDWWRESKASVGLSPPTEDLEHFLGGLDRQLRTVVPPAERFSQQDVALEAADRLAKGEPAGTTDLVALLTAPWLVRLTSPVEQADRVATAAAVALRKAAEGKNDG